MSQGKYSPRTPNANKGWDFFNRNCYGQIPPDYTVGVDEYDEKLHFADYDDEGFDRYGYSAFDADRNYVGVGNGIDRLGYTEFDYITMDPDDFDNLRY